MQNINNILNVPFGKYQPEQFHKLPEQIQAQIAEEAKAAIDIAGDDFFMQEAITDKIILNSDEVWDNCSLTQYAKYYREIKDCVPNEEEMEKVGGVFYHYFNARGLDEEHVEGFKERIIPLILSNNEVIENFIPKPSSEPVIKEFRRIFRKYDVGFGRFGFGDWNVHALSSKNRPRNIAELLASERTLPASNFNRFEQNRQDAILLANNGIIPNRDLIHNQIPGSHVLIKNMLDYYERKDDVSKQNLINKLREEASKSNAEIYDVVGFDGLSNFEIEQKHLPMFEFSNYEKTIDGTEAYVILKRLEQNMRIVPNSLPEIDDDDLKQLFDEYQIDSGWKSVQKILESVNNKLVSTEKSFSLSPNLIHLIAYIERELTTFMRKISRKDLNELFYEPGFKEIIKFRDLIFSYDDFNENKFEILWNKFSQVDMDDDTQKNTNLKELATRTSTQVGELAMWFKKKNEKDLCDILWSGNLNREIQNLACRTL